MSNYFPLVFFFLLSLNLNTQKSNLLGDKTFNEVQVSLIQMDEGDFNVKLNFLNENDFICNKDALGAIIESLKNADTKKEYSNFFRLKSHNTEIKFLVRHDKKSIFIDVGEYQDFKTGDEKKVLRENTPALIAYLEVCYELINCV